MDDANTTSTGKRPPQILVVDDTPMSQKVLAGVLKHRGYEVRLASNGPDALDAALGDPPDLILLDVMMPGMDGYEVCVRLKADARIKDIPVIFISALSDALDKVKAFTAGAVDYIAKPFEFEEVRARVATHLTLREQRRQLQESYDRLRQMESLRDNLVHMVVHDMRAPLMSIDGYLQLVAAPSPEDAPEDLASYIEAAVQSTHTLMAMVSDLLDVSKMEAGEMKLRLAPCNMLNIVQDVVSSLMSLRGRRDVHISAPEEAAVLLADADLIHRVVQNIVGNALKFTPEPGNIRADIRNACDEIEVSVQDDGPGIPPEYHDRIFEKFGQVEMHMQGRMYSTGLGLAFCKLVVEAHGGHIGVESAPGQGSRFWFRLPWHGASTRSDL
jgi:signal transduction histidine kinase